MSLELAINNALSGLNVNQRALSVVSQNIANATTEGYTRKTIEQSAIYIGREQLGSGVRIDDVVRKVDTYLQRSTRTQTSISSGANTIDNYMERIQILLGQPGDSNTLNEYMDSFFNSMQALAQTPERISFREGAVDSANILAREISSLAGSLEDLRLQADNDIATSVEYVNQYLSSLDKINVAITNAAVLGNPISGLQDEQDKLIKKISEIVDVKVLVQPNTNEVYLYTSNGIALLDDSAYELSYSQPYSVENFINDSTLNPVEIYRLDNNGNRINSRETLVTGGKSAEVTSKLESGSIKSLLKLRDNDIPDMLTQLDEMATKLRDLMNMVHNQGSSFPPPHELNGTREVNPNDDYNWSGKVMIAALDKNGQPIPSPYSNEQNTGIRPLTLDLSKLDTGNGVGQPSVQGIIDEINHHFNPPTTKVSVGNLNNIQLVSNTDRLPSSGLNFNFDFDLENIAKQDSQFFVTAVNIADAAGAAVIPANFTTTRPNFTIGTYSTTTGSNSVGISTTAAHGLKNGDVIYMNQPLAAVNGINATNLEGYFTISDVTTNGFNITSITAATATGAVGGGTTTIFPPYDTITAGEKRRTNSAGTITADLSGAAGSAYYDISVSVGVRPTDATAISDVKLSVITYRVYNNNQEMQNDRYDNIQATINATRTVPSSIVPQLRAIMVDANGVELAKTSYGDYVDANGFLKIVGNSDYTVAIDELDSKQLGLTTTSPIVKGTNRGFSHFFELNNFFESNKPTATGDTRKNSAINLKIEDRFQDNSNLISVGKLERSNQSADPSASPIYTYERKSGNNKTAQDLAKLGINIQSFDEAGGLASSRQTMNGYAGEVLAFFASNAATSEQQAKDEKILLDGFAERMDATTSVNVDEELANMVLFQNAYTASARIITTANEMFDSLLQAVS
jgi:flagellar hook-associated protein 1 FlgK